MQLRNYQRNAIDAIYNYFENRSGNPLIVLGTGSGKSIVIAKFCQEVLAKWPNERILILAHRKELLEQNAGKILAAWPEAPLGVYSAGLKKRELGNPITVAGIQSVYKKAGQLGWFSLIIIDECQLLSRSGEGQYLHLINNLKKINQEIRIIGLTATPYRLDSGMLTEGKNAVFTDIAYELNVGDLVKAGYLSPLISKISTLEANLSGVHIRGREYVASELEKVMSEESLVLNTAKQITSYGADRKTWIIFCTGVRHVEAMTKALKDLGVIVEGVTGNTPSTERARILDEFKKGKIRAICNCDILSVGFDAPNIDMICFCRPTKSTGLYVQQSGRGMRLSPETKKEDCLVLDFAGNIKEHGPITDIIIKTVRKNGETKRELEKKTEFIVCGNCRSPNPVRSRTCMVCGAAFASREIKHDLTPHDVDILGNRIAEWVNIDDAAYTVHKKEGAPDSLMVRYYDNSTRMVYREWVCINHTGFPREKAMRWVQARTDVRDPAQVTLENLFMYSSVLKKPTRIKVKKAGKYWEVLDYDFTPRAARERPVDKESGKSPEVRTELAHENAM